MEEGNNKIILVTGSSKGLGLEIAKKFSNEGYSVILNSRNKKNLEIALRSLNTKIEHFIFCYDLMKKDSINALNDFLNSKKIFIDGIVHNLGGKLQNDSHPIDLKVLQDSLRLNLEVAIEINNFIIPQMIKKGGGTIIHIGSMAGLDGNASPCYSISKGALNIYIKNIARFYANKNVIIFGIIPGIIEHTGSEWYKKKFKEPEKYQNRLKMMPVGRFAQPQEIAEIVVSLAKLKNIQLTGSLIEIFGGM